MYFLNFDARTRFVAFNDTPQVEEKLGQWLLNERIWEELENNAFLQSNIVNGTPILGVFFKKNKTFITNSSGLPQVQFDGNPRSLLFAFGHYKVASASGSFSYDRINTNYTRHEISPLAYEGDDINLEPVFDAIEELKKKVDQGQIDTINQELTRIRADLVRLSRRNDPLDIIMPAIAAEAGARNAAIKDILAQINTLQAPTAIGVTDVTNYPTKDQFFDELSKRPLTGYVNGLVSTRTSETDFLSHVFNTSIHNPTYLSIGSPSNAQHSALAARMTAAEGRLTALEGLNPVRSIQGASGLLATNQGNGLWRVDAAGIGIGTGDKPQETTFFMGGLLAIATDTGGLWTAWETAQIIGVRVSVDQPSAGAPIVLDVKKNGISIYTTAANRPILAEGQTKVLAPLPDDVTLAGGDEISVDIVNVGTTYAGSDLTMQVRFEYTN